MLAKCANPACSATFHYFHEGRIFVFESKPVSMRGPPADPDYVGRLQTPQYFWLCSSCCSAMTLQPDGDHGGTVVRKKGVPRNIFADGSSHASGGLKRPVPAVRLYDP